MYIYSYIYILTTLQEKRKRKREEGGEDVSESESEEEGGGKAEVSLPISVATEAKPCVSKGVLRWKERLCTLQLALPAVGKHDTSSWNTCCQECMTLAEQSLTLKEVREGGLSKDVHNALYGVLQQCLMSGPMAGGKAGYFRRKKLKSAEASVPLALLSYFKGKIGELDISDKQRNNILLWEKECREKVEGKAVDAIEIKVLERERFQGSEEETGSSD
jgi:hypothetical protein